MDLQLPVVRFDARLPHTDDRGRNFGCPAAMADSLPSNSVPHRRMNSGVTPIMYEHQYLGGRPTRHESSQGAALRAVRPGVLVVAFAVADVGAVVVHAVDALVVFAVLTCSTDHTILDTEKFLNIAPPSCCGVPHIPAGRGARPTPHPGKYDLKIPERSAKARPAHTRRAGTAKIQQSL